jgi:hypothetical protein
MNAKSDADVFPDMVSPICTRSKIVLEIASELVGRHNPLWQARILLHRQGKPEWEMSLDAASTLKCIEAVVRRETTVTMVNPAAMLALAYRGVSPFAGSQPVRVIAVVPSNDQFVFAVRPEMGLHTFEEIATRQCPLCIGVRAIPDHSVHIMLGHIMEAAGFSAQALKGWGGEVRPLGPLPPFKDTERFRALVDGKINAIFDEAASAWLNEALHEA